MSFLPKKTSPSFKRPFNFFEAISNTLFVVIVGIFTTLILIFLSLSVVFFNYTYNQVILFSLLGIAVYSGSYKFFLKYYGHHLRNLNYSSFLIARKKLFLWLFWTTNSYLLACWGVLVLLAVTNGFGLLFPTSDSKPALVPDNTQNLKALGFILLFVHLFLMFVVKLIIFYWDKIFAFAHREFEKRRKTLEIVRSKANLG